MQILCAFLKIEHKTHYYSLIFIFPTVVLLHSDSAVTMRHTHPHTKTRFFLFSSNLLANPFNCNCHLAWLGDWLRRKRIVTGNPRCQSPYFLKEIPIQDVAVQDFACEDGEIEAHLHFPSSS